MSDMLDKDRIRLMTKMSIYGVCANSFYKRKHAVAKQNVKRYYRNLSRLEKMCKKEKNEQ